MGHEQAPAYQWFAKDALTDLELCAMTYEENGMYRTLLDHAWIDGGIPDDLPSLARILGVTLSKMKIVWVRISVKWKRVERDGRALLVNERQEQERANQAAWRQTLSEQGLAGAHKRWGKHRKASQSDSPANGPAIAPPSPGQLPGHAGANGPRMPLQSSVFSVPPNPPQGGEEVGEFWEAWRAANAALHRSLPLTPTARDYDQCRSFVARYPDAEWRATLLDVFLKTDYTPLAEKPRTLGWLLHWATWIDEQLRAKGRRPKSEAA